VKFDNLKVSPDENTASTNDDDDEDDKILQATFKVDLDLFKNIKRIDAKANVSEKVLYSIFCNMLLAIFHSFVHGNLINLFFFSLLFSSLFLSLFLSFRLIKK
jgi:hypothetical protein